MRRSAAQIEQYDRFLLKKRMALVLVACLTILLSLVYLGIGSMKISLADMFQVFLGKGQQKYQTAIFSSGCPGCWPAFWWAPFWHPPAP